METILDYVKRKLREAGPKRWPAIAAIAGSNVHAMRKIAYNDADNPGLSTVQPLVTFFQEVDAGKRELPPAEPGAPTIEPAKEARDAA